MSERHQLVAYLATLSAIVLLVGIGAVLAYNGKSVEAVGVAAAVTGLIGVIKLPTAHSSTANVEQADTVVVPSTPSVLPTTPLSVPMPPVATPLATTPSPAAAGQADSAGPAA